MGERRAGADAVCGTDDSAVGGARSVCAGGEVRDGGDRGSECDSAGAIVGFDEWATRFSGVGARDGINQVRERSGSFGAGASGVCARVGTATARVQAEAIARNLRENDPVARWSGMVSGDGLRTGDLADALASYWVLNWAMANGGESSAVAMQGVRQQVRWAVANRPALAKLTDAEKQVMAEEAMLNFVYEVTGYLQARQAGNEAMLGRFAEGAEMRFRHEMAVDLKSLMLTSKGLEARR